MHWISAADTHKGNVRARNEDAVFCCSHRALWAVADGMGGHKAGEYASEVIAQALSDLPLDGQIFERVDAVEDCLVAVNDHLRHHARVNCDGNTVGSTIVLMLARGDTGVAMWAGDSRLYRLRRGELRQVTRDHNPISDLLDSGAVSEQEAVSAETNIITRAVGGQRELHLDVAVFDIEPDDTWLLCSDGLYRELSSEQIAELLSRDVDQAVNELMQACLKTEARDNVSAVVARASA